MTIQDAIERAKKLGMERADRRRASPDDLRSSAFVREPVLAGTEAPVHYAALGRIEFDVATCAKNNILMTDEQPGATGHAATAYRLMRGRILHKIKGSNWSCIGITSAGPGEGKTVTALNLAISIAREKLRVVYLLDLDMRKPSVWNRCGCRPAGQLSQYFAGELALEQVLYQTSVENLVIAGACDPVQGASELLASTRLEELIKYVRGRSPGALVVFDLPPVLSTDEALVVAPRTDALYLVVSEGVTRRDGLARSVDMLSDFTVAGVILNRSSEELGADYYGY
jgi:Mrp family chromosome partitioning ATPase